MQQVQTKTVRVLSAQGSKVRAVASAVSAPKPVVGAGLKCCCEQT